MRSTSVRTRTMTALLTVGAMSLAAATFAQPAGEKPAQPSQPGQPAQPGQPGQPGGRQPGGPRGDRPASVEQVMKGMNRSLRALKRSIKSAEAKAENLAAVNELQRGCVTAKGMEPRIPAGKDKAAFMLEYRKGQIELLRKLIDLEVALMDGDTAKAEAALKAVEQHSEKAHESLGVKEEIDEEPGPRPGGGGR